MGVLDQCVQSKEFTQIANKMPEQVQSHYNTLWAKISQTNDFLTFRNFNGSQNIILPERKSWKGKLLYFQVLTNYINYLNKYIESRLLLMINNITKIINKYL